MRIESSAFKTGGLIPVRFTCDGDNVSPPLTFLDIPKNAVSLVLIMEDPDVPQSIRKDGMWDHWVVFNILPTTAGIEEGAPPQGTVGLSTKGVCGYGGPCPPDCEHRYFFRLFALDTMLALKAKSTKTDVLCAAKDHVLARAELMGRYDRVR